MIHHGWSANVFHAEQHWSIDMPLNELATGG